MEGDTGSHRDTHQQRRPHSNTVSGDRPPAIDTTLARNGSPSAARRNSEGSPRLPPPINISEPTPVDPMDSSPTTLSLQKHFPDNQVSSRASSPTPTPIAAPEQQHLPVTSSSTSAVSRLLRKPRSRASSLSTTGSVNNDEAASDKSLPKPTNNIGSSKLRNGAAAAAAAAAPRRASELTVDTRASSERTPSMAAGSIAAACNLEVASAKRNQDFHALFRSVPEEDPLIEGNVSCKSIVGRKMLLTYYYNLRLWMRVAKRNPSSRPYIYFRESLVLQRQHLWLGDKCKYILHVRVDDVSSHGSLYIV